MECRYFDQSSPQIIIEEKELILLWEFLAHQYISYENIELLTLVRTIGRIIDELAETSSRTTLGAGES
jgi:hypothetical protein